MKPLEQQPAASLTEHPVLADQLPTSENWEGRTRQKTDEPTADARRRGTRLAQAFQQLESSAGIHAQQLRMLLDQAEGASPMRRPFEALAESFYANAQKLSDQRLTPEEHIRKSSETMQLGRTLKIRAEKQVQAIAVRRNALSQQQVALEHELESLSQASALRKVWIGLSLKRRSIRGQQQLLQSQSNAFEKEQLLLEQQKREIEQRLSMLHNQQDDALVSVIGDDLKGLRQEYEGIWKQEKEQGILIDEVFGRYWKQMVDPKLGEFFYSEGENAQVIGRALYRVLKTHVHHRASNTFDDSAVRLELPKLIYSMMQNKEASYPYDLERLLEPLIRGELDGSVRRVFNHFFSRHLERLQNGLHSRQGEQWQEKLQKKFQESRQEGREFGFHDTAIEALGVESIDLDLWKCIRESPSARKAFGGEKLDVLDNALYRQSIDRALSDNGQGYEIDRLYQYPTPEVIRLLAVMAAADNNGYRLNHTNTALSKFAQRPDWGDLLNAAVRQYPQLKSMEAALLAWNKTPNFTSWTNARHPTIRDGVDPILLKIVSSKTEDTRLVQIAYEAGTEGILLETLIQKKTLPREDVAQLRQAMETIRALEGPFVEGELSFRGDWLVEFFRDSALQHINGLEQKVTSYYYQKPPMDSLAKCVALARAINRIPAGDKKSLAFLAGHSGIDIIKQRILPETVEAVLSLVDHPELLQEKDYSIRCVPGLETMLKDETRRDIANPEFIRLYASIAQEHRVWIDRLPADAQRTLLPQLKQIIVDDLLPVYASMPPSAFGTISIDQVKAIPKERRMIYMQVFSRISSSPSQEIQRLRDVLVQQLLETNDPIGSYEQIEDVFIKNNLPIVGKVYQVFQILYPASKLKTILGNSEHPSKTPLSPVLCHATPRRRQWVIYKDLLRTHVRSGNRSLREYLEVLQSGEDVMLAMEAHGLNGLDARQQEQMRYFLDKVETLFRRSQLGQRIEYVNTTQDFEDRLEALRKEFGAREGQTITARLSEMFLEPIGLKTIAQVQEEIQRTVSNAHERGLQYATSATLTLSPGDLLKGVNVTYIANILQNGSVAGEYLGASSGSDLTPLDTDVSMVLASHMGRTEDVVNASLATQYGDLILAVKDRGQFQKTTGQKDAKYDPDKIELFCTGVHGERHYGIRTGFPTTEIDFMIAQPQLLNQPRQLDKIYYEIAQNGFYIPVADQKGTIIFTPEMYHQYRSVFNGLDRYQGGALPIRPTTEADPQWNDVAVIRSQYRQEHERIEGLRTQIRSQIQMVLSRHGVELKSAYDTGLFGAELSDIGSTGRGTSMPGDADFDFTVRLDDKDFEKVNIIAAEMMQLFQPAKDDSHTEVGYYQLRAIGAAGLSQTADIDIGFVKKSELMVYGSHNAVSDKLEWIREHHGQEQYEDTIANIVVAKKILKGGEAYKKMEHGGIGGIGVENWILSHGGNVKDAFQSFYDAAYVNGGGRISLESFKGKYRVLDAGTNVKKGFHDDFIYNLSDAGYHKMLDTIERYLDTHKTVVN
ncbi:hypothetical protein HZA86_00710 [Candidatus Uhrbacteria bacterium]|nr:hypothetical protein [Candidatus Uhrbacteria bacterium]